MRGEKQREKERKDWRLNILFAIYTQSCLSLQFQHNGGILPMKNKTAASDTFYGSDFGYYATREAKIILNA